MNWIGFPKWVVELSMSRGGEDEIMVSLILNNKCCQMTNPNQQSLFCDLMFVREFLDVLGEEKNCGFTNTFWNSCFCPQI